MLTVDRTYELFRLWGT